MTEGYEERNAGVIADFRANDGFVGGDRPGRPILLLTTPGRVSGTVRTTPVLYLESESRYYVFASHGGSSEPPEWFLNLIAAGTTTVEVPGSTFTATPVVVAGEERDRLYAMQVELFPQFADYQAKTTRVIPVIALEPTS